MNDQPRPSPSGIPGSTGTPVWTRPLQARETDEEHRASTPLELFFDLCFVVAVAQAANHLHHALADDQVAKALIGYPTVFFAIWWAWMNFTWFASAYDNDDVAYRLAVLVQIAGALIIAAGVPRAFDDRDFAVVTLGYAVMRVALVAQWLRAARDDPGRRLTDRRYAAGVSVCMVGWGLLLLVPESVRPFGFVLMVAAELAVPIWAERAAPTTWHPHHITERYGLFTLIVLGESVAAASVGVQSGLDAGDGLDQLLGIAVGGLLIVFSMWWIYFAQPATHVVEEARSTFGITSSRLSFLWGYGHFVVFTSAAAVGAGLSLAVDQATGHAEITARAATLAVAGPVALYLLSVWALHVRDKPKGLSRVAAPCTAGLVVVAGVLAWPVPVIGLLLAVLIAVSEVAPRRR